MLRVYGLGLQVSVLLCCFSGSGPSLKGELGGLDVQTSSRDVRGRSIEDA